MQWQTRHTMNLDFAVCGLASIAGLWWLNKVPPPNTENVEPLWRVRAEYTYKGAPLGLKVGFACQSIWRKYGDSILISSSRSHSRNTGTVYSFHLLDPTLGKSGTVTASTVPRIATPRGGGNCPQFPSLSAFVDR